MTTITVRGYRATVVSGRTAPGVSVGSAVSAWLGGLGWPGGRLAAAIAAAAASATVRDRWTSARASRRASAYRMPRVSPLDGL